METVQITFDVHDDGIVKMEFIRDNLPNALPVNMTINSENKVFTLDMLDKLKNLIEQKKVSDFFKLFDR